jgi:hypothetical protein
VQAPAVVEENPVVEAEDAVEENRVVAAEDVVEANPGVKAGVLVPAIPKNRVRIPLDHTRKRRLTRGRIDKPDFGRHTAVWADAAVTVISFFEFIGDSLV